MTIFDVKNYLISQFNFKVTSRQEQMITQDQGVILLQQHQKLQLSLA